MQNTVDREALNNIHSHHRAHNSFVGKNGSCHCPDYIKVMPPPTNHQSYAFERKNNKLNKNKNKLHYIICIILL